jgi:hypothetical protein
MISFDDSEDSSRVDIPNIFLDDRENNYDSYVQSPSPPKAHRKARELKESKKVKEPRESGVGGRPQLERMESG